MEFNNWSEHFVCGIQNKAQWCLEGGTVVSRNTIVRVYCLSTDGGALDETFQLDMVLHCIEI